MENEIWKDIVGFEGIYQVSNLGRVKSLERTIRNKGTKSGFYHISEKILSPRKNINRHGYYEISLKQNGKEKRFKLHRLVAIAFIPNPNNLPQVNHKDGNKDNNTVNNLEWCTDKENKKHAWENNLCSSSHRKRKVRCIQTGQIFESVVDASKKIPCDRRGLFRVLSGEKQQIKGYSFEYIEEGDLNE